MEKLLLTQDRDTNYVKPVAVLPPDALRTGLSPVAWEILEALHDKPSYPGELADKLDVKEQNVYYHIRNLRDNGLIHAVKEEQRRGATATYYAPVADAFAAELPGQGNEITVHPQVDAVTQQFFEPFITENTFTGRIIVGAPTEHGPYHTEARDGHHGIVLGMFLGQYCHVPTDTFPVQLDTETEMVSDSIVIGGPLVNTATHEFNDDLPVRFTYGDTWQITSDRTGDTYNGESTGVVARFPHPQNPDCTIILLAGLHSRGTQTCVSAVTRYADTVLQEYAEGEPFYRVVAAAEDGGILVHE